MFLRKSFEWAVLDPNNFQAGNIPVYTKKYIVSFVILEDRGEGSGHKDLARAS